MTLLSISCCCTNIKEYRYSGHFLLPLNYLFIRGGFRCSFERDINNSLIRNGQTVIYCRRVEESTAI